MSCPALHPSLASHCLTQAAAQRHQAPRGMVLLVVTVVILMITLAGLSFVANMSAEHKAVRMQGDELQLGALIDSGVELLSAVVTQPRAGRDEVQPSYDNPDLFRAKLVLGDEQSDWHGRFSIISPKIENDEITGIRFGVENESARLNLVVLPWLEQQRAGAAREALMNLPGMTEATADAILDWIDGDLQSRGQGAEADYYAKLKLPYAPRNGPPVSLEELLLVKGVTRELLLGADANRNYQLESQETSRRRSSTDAVRAGAGLAWSSYLTVYSAERNVDPLGQQRIDLNGPDLSRLYTRLIEVFDQPWVRFIILYRQYGPYTDSEPGRVESSGAVDLSQPAQFRLDSILDLIGARVRVPGPPGQTPQVVASPFSDDRGPMREYLLKLLDYATTDSETVIRGRINVNDASRVVLRAVPGLNSTLVEQIVAGRGSRTAATDSRRRHAAWLLTEGLVDLPQMKTLMPYLTGGGDVFRAQIVAFFDEGGPLDRVELVLDATGATPRRVYWKNLRMLGPGFPREMLRSESHVQRP